VKVSPRGSDVVFRDAEPQLLHVRAATTFCRLYVCLCAVKRDARALDHVGREAAVVTSHEARESFPARCNLVAELM
jgi:hypothetical protein